MLRETCDVVLGAVGAEFIEQQERIQVGQRRAADDAGQAHAGTIGGGHATDGAQYADRFGKAHGDSCWMDAPEDGRHTAVRQWTAPQPIVPSLMLAARQHSLRTTKVLPQIRPVPIDRVEGKQDSLSVFPGESTS
ncbi:hypothetical protein G6F50_017199 [Rhizopus delemar]|uniref:Uncharacterized protein n=1 Tax=Rhizopus delemar TaxID=936053 RepID=A0A9P6XQZ4_9FUNG|nr:hypothetical protein G6F50_017199 [Rhizopus delemar]